MNDIDNKLRNEKLLTDLLDGKDLKIKDLETKLKIAELALIDARSWFHPDSHKDVIEGIDIALEKLKAGDGK